MHSSEIWNERYAGIHNTNTPWYIVHAFGRFHVAIRVNNYETNFYVDIVFIRYAYMKSKRQIYWKLAYPQNALSTFCKDFFNQWYFKRII